MVSIVIPAHNEEDVISRCLSNLLKEERTAPLEIVVACNGCTDRTAEIAREFGASVTVVETSTASKVAALNLGDQFAKTFPRIYVDADVVLTANDAHEIASVLEGPTLVASPRMVMNFSRSSWAVRAFYRVWGELPYTKQGLMGAGVYALSQSGRGRFDQFPDVIADDGYIRALFKPDERIAVTKACSVVTAPATIADLIKIKTRSRLGGFQLAARFPELRQNDNKEYGSAIWGVLKTPRLWPCIPVYVFVNLLSRRRARKQLKHLDQYRWERDQSSRSSH